MVPPRSRRSCPDPAEPPTPPSPPGQDTATSIDPDLAAQLREAEDTGSPVAAVVAIRRPKGRKPDPVAVRETFDAALSRVQQLTNYSPADVNVMASMASAYVQAPAEFVRSLIEQPEIVGAVAARPRTGPTETGS